MSLPESLQGDKWTYYTARTILPLIIWCAKNGRTITYGEIDRVIVELGWGHHVLHVQYGRPAGVIGDALIETEELWEDIIPPLNAIIVNAETKLPGKGVNYYLEKYAVPEEHVSDMSLFDRQALIEEIQADIFAYEYWDDILEEYGFEAFDDSHVFDEGADKISPPAKGGWSDSNECESHKRLKSYIIENPAELEIENVQSTYSEYLFASADRADVVFKTDSNMYAVE
ncbi:hypothetical protein M3P05_20615, partial [Sansalvadorimonas sp. 2012CJ34-2]